MRIKFNTLFLFLAMISFISGCRVNNSSDYLSDSFDYSQPWPKRVCFKEYCFNVELAADPQKRARGLMFREQLDDDWGMLFVYEEEQKSLFWMKNTLIPLDIIWINKDKEVVFIAKDVQPCRQDPCPAIDPGKVALYVLELNAGLSDDMNLKVGDKIRFE